MQRELFPLIKAVCLACVFAGLVTTPQLRAQNAPLDPAVAPADAPRLSQEELQQLVGPIALYPDPLVALILPASTFPSDIVLAARFVEAGEDPALADQKPWDSSVRSLVRYPDVVKWMDENLEWTTQLGYAYLAQPQEVMDAIQFMRNKAQSVGSLVDTPQQRIVREESYVRIVPASTEYVYVPYYDPGVVYYEPAPLVSFGVGCRTGFWLGFDIDWYHRRLYYGDWCGDWDYHHHHHHHDYDHYDDDRGYYGDTVYVNNYLDNCREWRGDSRRRLSSLRSFAEVRENRRLSSPSAFREREQFADVRRAERNQEQQALRERRSELAEWNRNRTARRDAIASLPGRERNRDDAARGRDRTVTPGDTLPSLTQDDRTGKGRDRDDAAKGRDRIPTPTDPATALTQDDRTGKGRDRDDDAKGRDRIPTPNGPATALTQDDRTGKGRGRSETTGSSSPATAPGTFRDAQRGRPDIKGVLPKSKAPSVSDNQIRSQDRDKRPGDIALGGGKGKSAVDASRPDVKDLPRQTASDTASPRRSARDIARPDSPKLSPQVTKRPDVPKAAPSARPTSPVRSVADIARRDSPKPSPQVAKRPDIPKAAPSIGQGPPKPAPVVRQSPPKAPAVSKKAPSGSGPSTVRQSPPKPQSAPVVRKSSPRPSAPAVRKSSPKPSAPVVRKSSPKPSAPVVRKSSPKPSAPVVRKSSPKPSAPVVRKSSPRPSAPAVRKSAPKPSQPAVRKSAPRPSQPAVARQSAPKKASAPAKRPAPKAKPSSGGSAGGEKKKKK
jgi:hypothetical protein